MGLAVGLALGYPLGVFSYLATYALFQKDSESRTRKRIALASQQAAVMAREQANKLHRLRSLRGDQLDQNEQPTEEMEQILGTGPTLRGGGR